jgi:hypothetical protein
MGQKSGPKLLIRKPLCSKARVTFSGFEDNEKFPSLQSMFKDNVSTNLKFSQSTMTLQASTITNLSLRHSKWPKIKVEKIRKIPSLKQA